ncbi:MAG: hypothetical protein IJ432_01500 [Clostridia bacterium]|nr:hypothetical protein [Clostridia bacterium]
MASNFMLNVSPEFNMEAFSEQLANLYRARGYVVTVANMNGNAIISFEKNIGGINTVLGLGEGVKANCMVNNGVLNITFTDAEWTSKIIGAVIGWFLCLIPLITAIIGVVRQTSLPKNIENDVRMMISSMK